MVISCLQSGRATEAAIREEMQTRLESLTAEVSGLVLFNVSLASYVIVDCHTVGPF